MRPRQPAAGLSALDHDAFSARQPVADGPAVRLPAAMVKHTVYLGSYTSGKGPNPQVRGHRCGPVLLRSECRTRTGSVLLASAVADGCRPASDRQNNYVSNMVEGFGPSTSEGIYSASFDDATGELSDLRLAAEVNISPAWLQWHPTLPVLYAANETFHLGGIRYISRPPGCSGTLICPSCTQPTQLLTARPAR
jgi:hypothetical protein